MRPEAWMISSMGKDQQDSYPIVGAACIQALEAREDINHGNGGVLRAAGCIAIGLPNMGTTHSRIAR